MLNATILVFDGELFSLELQVENISLIDWERHNNVLARDGIRRNHKDRFLTSLSKSINIEQRVHTKPLCREYEATMTRSCI